MGDHRKIISTIAILLLILTIGIVGYSMLLNVTFVDALYMTVITISTVGYKEISEMTPEAKIFSIFVIFFGLSFVGYVFTNITSFILEGNMRVIIQKRRLESNMKKLEQHYIICGAGETGINVIRHFSKSQKPFVVIDNNRERVDELLKNGIMALYGNATDESVLIEAGIKQAKGLICSLASDADNVFTVLTSRYLNNDLYIISRAIDDHAHDKLIRAGANRTLSPNEIGGRRMAALMLRPTVISFLDMITHVGEVVLDLEEVAVTAQSVLNGKTLREAHIPEKTGLIILAVHKGESDRMIFNPGSSEKLQDGDVMIVLGTGDQIERLGRLASEH